MYSGADWSVTPRPVYPADGRKIPGIYTHPSTLGAELQESLGPFPFFQFWGPGAGIASSDWIGRCAEQILERHRPTLTLVYLPHLDYDFQRQGPEFPGSGAALREVDAVAGRLIELARRVGMEVMVLSEYGITPVTSAVSPNRVLRREGFLAVQQALSWELLDPGASRAFAVCDHQVAHVYVRDSGDVSAVQRCLEAVDGVDVVLDRAGLATHGLDHERSGELLLIAEKDRWFDYYYWLEDSKAPDYAPTVDIHRKPGYDPAELFLDPDRRAVRLRVLWNLAKKKLGFRYLMDVIPTRSDLVKGSHGRLPESPSEGPVLIASSKRLQSSRIQATDVSDLILQTVFGG
jgi:predicted AlkP superfamily pyrophosphatase or phosphodiesterase